MKCYSIDSDIANIVLVYGPKGIWAQAPFCAFVYKKQDKRKMNIFYLVLFSMWNPVSQQNA